MTRSRARQIRDFSLHPHILKDFILLQQFADVERQFGDGEGLLVVGQGKVRVALMGG